MNIHFSSLASRCCTLALLLIGLWLPSAAFGQAQSLGEFLDEQGRLAIPEGFSGSLDPEGFEMQTGADGAPRFLAKGARNVIPGVWQTFGGVNFGCNANINAIAVDASGLVYLGGQFTVIGEQFTVCGEAATNAIAAYNPVKNKFQALESGGHNGLRLGSVQALAASGNNVYAGGRFTQAGGESAVFVARWDGSAWHALGSGGQNGVNENVEALAVSGDDVYVGGGFTLAGGQPANRVARWDGSEWHALGSGEQNGVDSGVRGLAVSGEDVYVVGDFTEAGGQPANRVARWDGSEWHALESGGENGITGSGFVVVLAVAVSGDDVYVGGSFSEAGGELVGNVARWDGSEWHPLLSGGQNGVNFGVRTLAAADDGVYVGGVFTLAGGQTANRVARWDGSQWDTLVIGGQSGVNNGVSALAVSDNDVYVGGEFSEAGGERANRVARWDGSDWQALGNGGQKGVNDVVFAMAVAGDDVYVGGSFTEAGEPANRVARWDGTGWHTLGSGGQDGVSGVASASVKALDVSGGDVYVGGAFSQPGSGIARWDGSEWHPLGSGGQNGVGGGTVFALAVASDDVYVGGAFTQAGGEPANRIARWDGSDWHALESGGQNGVNNGIVEALAVAGDDVYVGGSFNEAGGEPASRIARWDGSDWHALESGGRNGVNGPVKALAISGSDVYVGGSFDEAGGQPANHVARWDGSEWHALDSGGQNGVNGNVFALTVAGEDVYLGGFFTHTGRQAGAGKPVNNVARWDGSRWASLGFFDENGVNQTVHALAVSGPSIHVGGGFGLAGGEASSGIATFINLENDLIFQANFEAAPTQEPGDTFKDCPVCPTMVVIPAGTFTQGSPPDEPESSDEERPQHTVSVTAFAMSQTEVTFDEWDACVVDGVCGHDPDDEGWGHGNRPVINVSWNDVQEYVAWLSNRTGQDYRLLSESEWEYATRAGTTGRFNTGDCITTDEANFRGTNPAQGCPTGVSRQQTLPVGSFAANAFGLYDTHGNVLEWVQDCWNSSYDGAPTDGSAWMSGQCSRAVLRGGFWNSAGRDVRSAKRTWSGRGSRGSLIGFRVARSVTP